MFKRLLAGLAICSASLFTVPASAAVTSHGTITKVIHSPDAGVCTIIVNWWVYSSSFKVYSTNDACSGGGTEYFQAKLRCAIVNGGDRYYYGAWKNQDHNTSEASGGTGCDGSGGGNGAVPDLGGFRYNMNNPSATTCWNPPPIVNSGTGCQGG